MADGTVFVASNDESQDADLVALDADPGDERWRMGVEAHVTGPVTWADGVLYLADDSGRIAAYDAGDGTRLWEHATTFPAAGGISVVDGTVYAGWGWWLAGAPDDADGGIIAFHVGGNDSSDADEAGDDTDATDDAGGLAIPGDPPAGDDDSAGGADGRDVYQQHCASCHGGDGSGSSGPSVAGVADRLDLEQHVAIVRDGGGEMPGWEGTLSDAEIDAVVAYERDVLDDEAAGDG